MKYSGSVLAVLALVLTAQAGCDPTPRNQRIASAITLAASTAALACDMGQTMVRADAGWPGHLYEGNPIMGPHPSVTTLAIYNGAVASANVGAWFTIPEEYNWVLPIALGAFETLMVAKNMVVTQRPFCGIR